MLEWGHILSGEHPSPHSSPDPGRLKPPLQTTPRTLDDLREPQCPPSGMGTDVQTGIAKSGLLSQDPSTAPATPSPAKCCREVRAQRPGERGRGVGRRKGAGHRTNRPGSRDPPPDLERRGPPGGREVSQPIARNGWVSLSVSKAFFRKIVVSCENPEQRFQRGSPSGAGSPPRHRPLLEGGSPGKMGVPEHLTRDGAHASEVATRGPSPEEAPAGCAAGRTLAGGAGPLAALA